jgi:hypothetical protein
MQANRTTATEVQRASNRRLGLVLFSVVLVFFVGFFLRRWLFG